MRKKDYTDEAYRQLIDETNYKKLNRNPIHKLATELNQYLKECHKETLLDDDKLQYLTAETPHEASPTTRNQNGGRLRASGRLDPGLMGKELRACLERGDRAAPLDRPGDTQALPQSLERRRDRTEEAGRGRAGVHQYDESPLSRNPKEL
ncbi:hypothetical protein NDU88_004093 [Pleurodeles waltl]|uniref:Uncharacterized protein n=1 Tax=Pleurodeles waltl TaxID=8319 RepID=A0AAV7MT06_PLEWA|nr:hypothetical protein NDU88_004093 [Pleurodeles waltl]